MAWVEYGSLILQAQTKNVYISKIGSWLGSLSSLQKKFDVRWEHHKATLLIYVHPNNYSQDTSHIFFIYSTTLPLLLYAQLFETDQNNSSKTLKTLFSAFFLVF